MTSSDNTGKQTEKSKDELCIEVVESSIQDKLKQVPSLPSSCCIFRVPETLLKENPDAYTPSIVSIGPLHHGLQHLQPMETRKLQYLNDFLHRESQATLRDYIEMIADLEEKARQCYPEVIKYSKDEFVTLMVVDGCFLLELFNMEENTISSVMRWSNMVSLDLILLENQLPFFVLEKLYQLYVGDSHNHGPDLSCLIGRYLQYQVMPRLLLMGVTIRKASPTNDQIQPHDPPKHLLDFLRYSLIPSYEDQQRLHGLISEKNKQEPMSTATKALFGCIAGLFKGPPVEENGTVHHFRFRCATELEQGGIKIEMNKNPILSSLLDIEFNEAKGVLTIPSIRLGSGAEVILRNLIAYEQYIDQYSYITEYAALFNGLIDTVKDVEVLQDHGVIENLRDPREVAELFNNLPKGAAARNFCIARIRNEVEQYYNNRLNRWKASLMLNYFNTPWAFISVVAAVILLVLTITQTIYDVLAYY